MDNTIAEIGYPLDFRNDIAAALGEHLQQQQSVELVGMKRVGINNFLRFFLFHEGIKTKYMPQNGKHFFIFIDLNDLIERELFPFWRLTFKRITDTVAASDLSEEIKNKISGFFSAAIQSGDLFLTYDGVREALTLLARQNIYPTLFLSRFDRLSEAATSDFFNNLESLKEATQDKLSYVFTSYRELDALMPNVFNRKNLALFSHIVYMRPTDKKDSEVILATMEEHYGFTLSQDMVEEVLRLAGGHVQYIQLALLILSEAKVKATPTTLQDILLADERITLQSEELWESLQDIEKEVLTKELEVQKLTEEDKKNAKYLWDTGFLPSFSPLFAEYVKKNDKKENGTTGVEFSKKEHLLFKFLEEHANEICEREDIVDRVWPEYKEYGVSDWSVDRLVARVRSKLKKQNSPYEMVTVRTRGYKLVTK